MNRTAAYQGSPFQQGRPQSPKLPNPITAPGWSFVPPEEADFINVVKYDLIVKLTGGIEFKALQGVPFFQIKSYISNAMLNGVWRGLGPGNNIIYPIQRVEYFVYVPSEEADTDDEESVPEVQEGDLPEDHDEGPGDGPLQ